MTHEQRDDTTCHTVGVFPHESQWRAANPQAREEALARVWSRATPYQQAHVLALLGAVPANGVGTPASDLTDHLGSVEGIAHRCLTYGRYFARVSSHPQYAKFWIYVQNALGEAFCLLWCHLFGSRKDDFHFSRLFDHPDIRNAGSHFGADAVRARLLAASGLSEDDYAALWRAMKRCRDKYVAHREDPAPIVIFPDIDQACDLVEALRIEYAALVDALLIHDPNHSWLCGHRAFYLAHSNSAVAHACARAFDQGLRISQSWLSQRDRPSGRPPDATESPSA